jgi:hypothetical protein
MRKLLAIAMGAASLACAAPAVAQDAEGDDALAAMAGLFEAEPLTAEQEARLPAAQAIIEKILPPGTLQEVMGSMFNRILDPLMALAAQPSEAAAANQLGVDAELIELDAEQSAEVLALLDPAWRERQERTMAVTQGAMGRMMTAMEPVMRTAMAELYAVNFDARELADIDVFFSTETGAAYARKSYAMSSDPRLMGALMGSLPEMMGSFAEMETELAAAVADLPPPRGYAELGQGDRARLGEITGLDPAEIEAGMARVAEANGAEAGEWD